MKNLIVIAASALMSSWFAGCSPVVEGPETKDPWISHGYGAMTKVVTIENHRYIVLSDGCRGHVIIHAASCGCMDDGR